MGMNIIVMKVWGGGGGDVCLCVQSLQMIVAKEQEQFQAYLHQMAQANSSLYNFLLPHMEKYASVSFAFFFRNFLFYDLLHNLKRKFPQMPNLERFHLFFRSCKLF